MGVPKPRREGQFGGMNHRSNHGSFRASGGHVKPPSKSCLVLAVLMVTVPVGLALSVAAVIL